ncbi:hypothetical protein [Actinokineospora diospyrosa]|uniref:Lactococcin 972 family bacteriocin n=1 Tax=Actinokineospora diospyrosa TaxID=103728 RepID=A0ABT1IJN2_9PSEU|nr:hypothetical protein [Actinokineospora diospyrosa]MCP2272748.1 hypothetical protein [Actinokineospora diospyrosa]
MLFRRLLTAFLLATATVLAPVVVAPASAALPCGTWQYSVSNNTWLSTGPYVPAGSIFNVSDRSSAQYWGNAYYNHDAGSYIGTGGIWASNLNYLRCW